MTFSLVLPCFNEEENIGETIQKSLAWMRGRALQGEVIIVNDGSRDGSANVLAAFGHDPMVKVVTHEKNKGYGAALASGVDAAESDVVGFMDSDGQFEAEDFNRLLPLLEKADFVTGFRMKRADPLPRLLNSFLYNTLVRFTLGIHVRDINCAMKIFRRSLWSNIRPSHATGALFNAELFLYSQEHGITVAEVGVPHYPRLHGNPTGAKPSVILRMFRELRSLKRAQRARMRSEV